MEILSIDLHLTRLCIEIKATASSFVLLQERVSTDANLYGGEFDIDTVDSWLSLIEKETLYRGFKAIQ